VSTFADRGVSHSQCGGSPTTVISIFWIGAATFLSSISSIVLTRLSGPRFRPTTSQKLYRPSDHRLSAKLVPTFGDRGVSRGQRDGSLQPYSQISGPEPLLFLPRSSSIVLARLIGPRSRPTTSQKIWQRRESNPDLWMCSQEL
jgi:hypothetical protein